jgi:hypothetical protein
VFKCTKSTWGEEEGVEPTTAYSSYFMKKVTKTQISGSRSGVNENPSLLESDVVSTGKYRFPRKV